MRFEYEPEKALESLLYVCRRVRDNDMYLSLKTLYMADKDSLAKYGRFLFGDWYCAMEHGPVGSHAYDIVKFARGENRFCDVEDVDKALRIEGNRLVAMREPDLSWLSSSDIECLDNAIESYGLLRFRQAKDRSHDQAWRATERNRAMPIDSIAATVTDNPAELIHHLSDRFPSD